MIRDESTSSVALDLIKSCLTQPNTEAQHQSLRALDAIVTELSDAANANKVFIFDNFQNLI